MFCYRCNRHYCLQVRIIRAELEDQERSLKAAVATQEKKAHENWVAARQAERKLTEFQVSVIQEDLSGNNVI